VWWGKEGGEQADEKLEKEGAKRTYPVNIHASRSLGTRHRNVITNILAVATTVTFASMLADAVATCMPQTAHIAEPSPEGQRAQRLMRAMLCNAHMKAASGRSRERTSARVARLRKLVCIEGDSL